MIGPASVETVSGSLPWLRGNRVGSALKREGRMIPYWADMTVCPYCVWHRHAPMRPVMSDANLYHIRSYTPADGPAVVALQTAYAERYPGAAVIPAAVYGMPGFGDGANIFCAVDRNGDIVAYAPVMPELVTAHAPDLPHTLWAEIKAHPQLAQPGPVKDLLLDAVWRAPARLWRPWPRARPAYSSSTCRRSRKASRTCVAKARYTRRLSIACAAT